jgi:hypothetical protein
MVENPLNQNPFAEHAAAYLERGYSPIPVVYGEKRPAIKEWSLFAEQYPTEALIAMWGQVQRNIAICTGRISGVIGFDFDNDIDGIHAKILAIVPDSPVKKRGAKGFTAFYRYNGESSRQLSYKGQQICDILSDRRLCTLPPSIHPDTKEPYKWDGVSLLDIDKSELPIITVEMWTAIDNLLGISKPAPQSMREPCFFDDTTKNDIRDALACISPDLPYDAWCKIGMALHSHSGGADWALNLFDNWSASGKNYKQGEPTQKWKSFVKNGVGIGTLFYIAGQHGYKKINEIKLLTPEQEITIRDFLHT